MRRIRHDDETPSGHRRMPAARILAATMAALLATACASGRQYIYTADELRSEVQRRAPGLRPAEIVVPFEVSPELAARARAILRGRMGAAARAEALADALTDEDGLGLEYDPTATGTAIETVRLGLANCLSMSTVFIGLARSQGLDAFYVDLSGRKRELRQEKSLIVSAGHITAGVSTEKGLALLDFEAGRAPYQVVRRIDDLEALAQYYSNRGYFLIEEAQDGGTPIPWERVLRDFDLATQVSPGLASAHNNLGIAYSRLGRDEEAQGAYRASISHQPDLASPHTNLGSLHLRSGDVEAALAEFAIAADLDPKNPYLHMRRARAFLDSGSRDDAIRSLERALDLKEDYAGARALLGALRSAGPAQASSAPSD